VTAPGPRRRRLERIGIWADYAPGFLDEQHGIGTFLVNLVRGLVAEQRRLAIDLVVHDDDRSLPILQELEAEAKGRLRLLSADSVDAALSPQPSPGAVAPAAELAAPGPTELAAPAQRRGFTRLIDAAWVLREPWRQRLLSARRAVAGRLLERATALAAGVASRSPRALVVALLAAPWLFVASWVGYAALDFALATVRVLLYPVRVVDRVVRRLPAPPRLDSTSDAPDAWLVPYVGLTRPAPRPNVVVVHDLVNWHFPDTFPPELDRAVRAAADARVREATLIASMSEFIREADLLGTLGLPRECTRVVAPATPVFPPALRSVEPEALPFPYLLYPASNNCYKNHRLLVEALPLLRDPPDAEPLGIVFTGGESLPGDLEDLAIELGVRGRILLPGKVERRRLAALYRGALATVVPSLYEQGSFPIYEALDLGCPVACARIRPLVEQCRPMGDAMLYFDPREPHELARTIDHLRRERERVRERQQRALRAVGRRTWRRAAREWSRVLLEAARLGPPMASPAPEAAEAPAPAPSLDGERVRRRRLRRRRGPTPVFLFLRTEASGGVWRATVDLLLALAAVNEERGGLALTVGLVPRQTGRALLATSPSLRVVSAPMQEVDRHRASAWVDPGALGEAERSCWPAAPEALEAEVWLALNDRFTAPLLPRCPHVVVVHDLLFHHLPAGLDPPFFDWWEQGMRPTVRRASAVVVGNRATAADVEQAYGAPADRIHVLPTAWDAAHRFAGTMSQRVAIEPPFVLCVANASPHKGVLQLLEARAHMPDGSPRLVVCGHDTQWLGEPPAGFDHPHWQRVRACRQELGLELGRDIVFLGTVRDGELVDLLRRTAVVVNAATWDSGSFSLIEGAYFGRPLASTDSPGARELAERFDLEVVFASPGDPERLAAAIGTALERPPAELRELRRRRARLAHPELGVHRRAERMHELLSGLAGRT
jgi:glycosyltransferase involved in cell wall biosynthesis